MADLTNPVLTLQVDDSGLTPGATAAAAALNKVADAATTVETRVGRVSASASTLVNRLDPVTKATNALTAAQNNLATSTDTLTKSLANGDITQAQYQNALTTLQAKVQKASDAVTAASAGHTQLATAVHGTSLSLGQVAPQFVQLFSSIQGGQPIITSLIQQGHQLGDQMLVTGTSVGQLAGLIGNGLKSALGAILSPIGLAVSGAALLGAGIYAVTSAAESSQSRLVALQTQLRSTRDDYAAMATEATAAAKAVAAATTISTADARTGAQILVANPNFTGTQAQLQTLIILGANLAKVMNTDIPTGEKVLASAMDDAGKVAQTLAEQHIAGVTSALVDQVKQMTAAGQNSQGFGVLMDALKGKFDGATQAGTPLQKALHDLDQAFTQTGQDGHTFAESLGKPFTDAAASIIESLASITGAIDKARQNATVSQSGLGIGGLIGGAVGYLFGAPNTSSGGIISGQSSSLPPAILEQIQSAAQSLGATSSQTNFATRIAAQESGGRQFNSNGGVLTSSAGNLGIFQLGVGTASDLGVNPNLTSGNIQGGIQYAIQMLNKYGGNEVLAAAAYNWGPGNLDKYLAGLKTTVPAETQAYVKSVTGADLNRLAGPLGGNADITLPPVDITASRYGVANPNATAEADKVAASIGTSVQSAADAAGNIAKLQAGLDALGTRTAANAGQWDRYTEALQKANLAQADAIPGLAKLEQPINANIKALTDEAAAWAGGAEAAGKATIAAQAATQARTIAAPNTAQYAVAVAELTAKLTAQANAEAAVAAAQQLSQGRDQITYLQTEIATLGQDYDQRQKILAALQEKQALEQSGKQYSDADKQSLIDQKVALAGVTDQLQLMQSSLQEVGNFGVQIFDQVGSAITNAFISGQGAAINFGSILKSVAGIALQELGKLAIGNVLSNTLGGTNLPTIGSVFSALGGASTTGAPATGQSALGGLSNLYQLGSGVNTLTGGWLGNSLGITGPNGAFSGVGNYVSGLFGNSTNAALSGLGQGVYGPATASQVSSSGLFGANGSLAGFANTPLFGSATIGSAFSGIGAGYGLGSLAGGYVQGAFNKTGPAPQIGAATGALAGAAIGSVVPVIGTLIGGALGGLLGGAGGGLIGPHVATPYSSLGLDVQGTAATGFLQPGKVLSQLDPNVTAEQQQRDQAITSLNNLLQQSGIRIYSTGGVTQIGDRINPGETDKTADIASAFPGFRFNVADTSTDEGRALAGQVNGKSFSGLDQLQAVFTEVDTFINQTLPSLTTQQANIGSLQATLNSLTATFQPAIDEGNKLGVGVDALTAAYAKQTQAAQDAVATQVANDQTGFQASYLAAKAQVSGSSTDAQTAALFSFDSVTAPQQRQQLIAEYQGIFGDAYASTAQYVQTSAALEQSLGEQRLAIQTQYNNQITASATQAGQAAITSLQAYIQKLQGSSSSPLSPLAQYAQAKSQFQAVSGAASAGDANSINNLPTYADAFLSASRAVNNSGAAYATDYSNVLSSVSSVASLGPDALTQSFMAAQMQSQTAAIVTAIQAMQTQIAGLQAALTQASNAPARIAA